jgi:hypothetical protein
MTYFASTKGTHYHRFFVDAETNDQICLCGAVKDKSPDAPRKFHNNTTEYNGILYDSKLESRSAADLDWLVKAKEIKSWDRQVRIPFNVCLICAKLNTSVCPEHPKEKSLHLATYICDFKAYHNDGTIEYIEAKGMETDVFRLKWKLMEAVYGNRDDVRLTLVKEPRTNKRY